ncbi:hypothetical protein FA15DRAFT_604314 [Coprinopsis marcescibilis]|uniref:DUF659 domain-containing protein n=1 Tax=Coprinopsis marcescibilis TaxID=230819 RepID=A0A5C3KDD3_COPMA|nr:hypothetical protein FA15DRAFT_604314 [Coprinopsis marcescibilis]
MQPSLPSRSHSQCGPGNSALGLHIPESNTLYASASIPNSPRIPNWTKDDQRDFENKLGELTVSAGLPLSWVDNPQFLEFMDRFIPSAKPPSRKTLTTRIIPGLVKSSQKEVKTALTNQMVTLQADGWTGINHRHIVAFMVGSKGKIYTVDIVDVTTERKTADHFLADLEAAYHKAQNEMKVSVICVVTDASGEAAKARRLFKLKYPHVIVLDCYAHQVCPLFIQVVSFLKYS